MGRLKSGLFQRSTTPTSSSQQMQRMFGHLLAMSAMMGTPVCPPPRSVMHSECWSSALGGSVASFEGVATAGGVAAAAGAPFVAEEDFAFLVARFDLAARRFAMAGKLPHG